MIKYGTFFLIVLPLIRVLSHYKKKYEHFQENFVIYSEKNMSYMKNIVKNLRLSVLYKKYSYSFYFF